jgi:hypothetical protein
MTHLIARLLVIFSLLIFSFPVYAALPIIVATTIKDLQIDFGALLDLGWPLIAVVISAFWIIRLFKRVVFST